MTKTVQTKTPSAFRNTLTVMLGTLGSRLLGLVRQMVFNRFDTHLTDAFGVAYRVPMLFRELLAEGALVNSFIPVYKALSDEEKPKMAAAFTGLLLGINLLLMGLGILGAPWMVDILVNQNSTLDRDLAVYLTRIMVPVLGLISMASVAMGLLNAGEHFKETSFAPIAFNVVSIAVMLIFPHTALWLGLSTTLGGLAQLLVQIPSMIRLGIMPVPNRLWHPALAKVLLMMLPFMLTTSSRQFLNVFLTNILTQFPKGAVTAYLNAETVFQLALGLFVISPALALYPRLAGMAAEQNWDEFKRFTLQALRLITFAAAPISALLCVLAGPAVSIFYLSTPDPDKFYFSQEILRYWALALLPWGMNALLVRTFYVRQRSWEPLIITSIAFIADVTFYYILLPHLHLATFGLTTTVTGTLANIALMLLYRKHLGGSWYPLVQHLLKVVPLGMIAGLVSWLTLQALIALHVPTSGTILHGLLGLGLAGGAGILVYLALAVALKMPEMQALISKIKR